MQTDTLTYADVAERTSEGVNSLRTVVVIPAYNEARFIGSVVLMAHKCADTVLVVDDGSSDATAEIAAAAGAIVVRHTQNVGKGAALNTALDTVRELNPLVVITLDADGQHVPEEIHSVVKPILAGTADIAVGSRYLENTSKVPIFRILGHHAFNFITNEVSGVRLSDSQSGFRAFSPRAVEAMRFDSKGFSVESEMQLLASQCKLTMVEVPITIRYDDRPKRPLLVHGLMVLSGVLRLVGQYRPLLFFGLAGLILTLIGLGWGFYVVNIYLRFKTLAVGYTLLSVLLILCGILSLFTGIVLHSIRGLLTDLIESQQTRERKQVV
jgi:glycosyltransferase involved in cell wall biosynthesis